MCTRLWLITPVAMATAFLAVLPGTAAPAESGDLLDRLHKRYRAVAAVTAEFVQKEKVATLGRVRESRGTVILQRPGKMRWEYTEPERRLVISDGRSLWIYMPDEGTAYVLPLDPAELSRTPLAVLFQEGRDLREFFTPGAVTPVADDTVRLDLKPLTQSTQLTSMSLLIDPRDGNLKGTVIRDAYGNVTEIRLGTSRQTVPLEDSRFVFKPPPGTRILTSREAGR